MTKPVRSLAATPPPPPAPAGALKAYDLAGDVDLSQLAGELAAALGVDVAGVVGRASGQLDSAGAALAPVVMVPANLDEEAVRAVVAAHRRAQPPASPPPPPPAPEGLKALAARAAAALAKGQVLEPTDIALAVTALLAERA